MAVNTSFEGSVVMYKLVNSVPRFVHTKSCHYATRVLRESIPQLRWQECVLTPYQEGAAVARGGAAGQRRLLDTRDRQEQVVSACPSEAVNLSTHIRLIIRLCISGLSSSSSSNFMLKPQPALRGIGHHGGRCTESAHLINPVDTPIVRVHRILSKQHTVHKRYDISSRVPDTQALTKRPAWVYSIITTRC